MVRDAASSDRGDELSENSSRNAISPLGSSTRSGMASAGSLVCKFVSTGPGLSGFRSVDLGAME